MGNMPEFSMAKVATLPSKEESYRDYFKRPLMASNFQVAEAVPGNKRSRTSSTDEHHGVQILAHMAANEVERAYKMRTIGSYEKCATPHSKFEQITDSRAPTTSTSFTKTNQQGVSCARPSYTFQHATAATAHLSSEQPELYAHNTQAQPPSVTEAHARKIGKVWYNGQPGPVYRHSASTTQYQMLAHQSHQILPNPYVVGIPTHAQQPYRMAPIPQTAPQMSNTGIVAARCGMKNCEKNYRPTTMGRFERQNIQTCEPVGRSQYGAVSGADQGPNSERELTFQQLQQHFTKPLEQVRLLLAFPERFRLFHNIFPFFFQAARELGLCSTLLKKYCRKLGIKRWPYRQVTSLQKSLESLQTTFRNRAQKGTLSAEEQQVCWLVFVETLHRLIRTQ